MHGFSLLLGTFLGGLFCPFSLAHTVTHTGAQSETDRTKSWDDRLPQTRALHVKLENPMQLLPK